MFFLFSLTFITFNPIITQANENIPFDAWIKNIEELAINKGIASETIQKSLDGVEPNKRVLELDRNAARIYAYVRYILEQCHTKISC
jgi:membrane-bound lytic murein transglycosylase B